MVDRLHNALRDRVRDAEGRDPMASAGCVDAQSVRGADTVGAAVRGFDAAKKVNGRKRHVVVDTMGLLLLVVITSAGMQDRDGARTLLEKVKMVMPSLSLLWADGGYAGKLVERAERIAHITVEIVRKPVGIKTFQVLPRRWVVERTFAWISKRSRPPPASGRRGRRAPDPRLWWRRIASREQGRQIADERQIPLRAPQQEQSLDLPRLPETIPRGGDLGLEAADRVAAIEEQIPDLDDGRLSPGRPGDEHVDGPGTRAVTRQGELRNGVPAATRGQLHDHCLATEVLDVAGQARSGERLDERSQLHVQRGRTGGERVERDARLPAALDPAVVRLRDAGPRSDIDLPQTLGEARVTQADLTRPAR